MLNIRSIISIFVLLFAVNACAAASLRDSNAISTRSEFEPANPVTVVKSLEAEVVDESWHPATFSWPRFDRGLFYWTATLKNDAPQSRDICVVFRLYGAKHQMLLGVRDCRVVASRQEGHISSSAFVNLDLLKQATSGQARPYESHKIYYPKAVPG